MALDPSRRLVAVGQALLVTFIWSTSFVVTKWIYAHRVQPLTLSGLRYGLAVLLLAPLWWSRHRAVTTSQSRLPLWLPLLLDLAGYAVNAGGYNIGLFYLDATQVGLLLGLNNTFQVLLWSALLLREWPTRLQGLAIGGALAGVVLFHYPSGLGANDLTVALPVFAAGVGYALCIVQPEPGEWSGSARSHLALDGLGLGGSRSRGARSGGHPANPRRGLGSHPPPRRGEHRLR